MLTAVRPATDDSFVSEANVPFSFSPAPAEQRTRGPACTLSRGPYCKCFTKYCTDGIELLNHIFLKTTTMFNIFTVQNNWFYSLSGQGSSCNMLIALDINSLRRRQL